MRNTILVAALVVGCTDKAAIERAREVDSLRAQVTELQGRVKECESRQSAVVHPASLGAAKHADPELRPQFPGVFGVLAKSYTRNEAAEIMRAITSAMSQRAEIMSRTLGYDIRNNKGQIDLDMANRVVRDFRRRAYKVFGRAAALRVLRNQWGDLAGSAIYNADDSELSATIKAVK